MKLRYQRTGLSVLGWLSILLPALLVAGTALLDQCTVVLASVSHYYYTSMSPLFVGVLYATGVFLCVYKGDTLAERFTARLAGVCVTFVAFLPTSQEICGCCVRPYISNPVGEEFHKAFAAFFLLAMSVLFCLFAQRNDPMTPRARTRNRLYYTCAALISLVVFTIVAASKSGWLAQGAQQQLQMWMGAYKPIFWLEWLALAAVGTSWLTKGGWLLADSTDQRPSPVFGTVELVEVRSNETVC